MSLMGLRECHLHSLTIALSVPHVIAQVNFQATKTNWEHEMANHIHLDGEKAIDMAYDVNISTKSDKRVVIFPLKLAQIVPGRPKCP